MIERPISTQNVPNVSSWQGRIRKEHEGERERGGWGWGKESRAVQPADGRAGTVKWQMLLLKLPQ